MSGERWRWVVGYEGLYMVSDYGRVKRVKPSRGAKVGRVLRQAACSNGYRQVTLSDGCKRRIHRVHRLVAEAFAENPEGKRYVNHIDGDKTNNRVENLEWCTRSENMLHSYRVLGHKRPHAVPDRRRRKLTDEQIVGIYNSGGIYAEIARRYGISDVMARKIKTGKCWKDVTCRSTV